MNIEKLKEKIEQFYENHPVWFWLLARLAACTAIMWIVVFALLAVACVFGTIAALIGAYWGILAICLIIIPVLCACVWAGIGAFCIIHEEFIEC